MQQRSDTRTIQRLPRLNAGSVVQVISRDGKQTFISPLVAVDGDCLVLARPYDTSDAAENASGWNRSFFEFNRWLLIRAVDRGVVFACEARVLEVNDQRAHLTLQSAPREIYRRPKRASRRFDCSLCIHMHGHCQRSDGRVENISETGCQLAVSDHQTLQEIRQLQASNQHLCFEVLFPHADTYRTLQGRVVTVIEDDDHGCHHIGVQFRSDVGVVVEYINLLRLD